MKVNLLLERRHTCLVGIILMLAACGSSTSSQALIDGDFLTIGQNRIDLLVPTDNSATSQNPIFIWGAKIGISQYRLEVSANANFSQIILSKVVSGNSYTLRNSDLISIAKLDAVEYFWRVRTENLRTSLESSIFSLQVLEPNVFYVNGNSTATLQVGNKTAPFKKIQSAMDIGYNEANSPTTPKQIKIAQGTYSESITLRPNVSIYGGYEAVNWSKNSSNNPTTINAVLSVGIYGGSDVSTAYTATTIVDGLIINGGNISGAASSAIYLNGSAPTISGNRLNGGASDTGYTYGIFNTAAAAPVIINNIIYGGLSYAGVGNSVAINSNSSTPVISNNILIGGPSNNGAMIGIYNTSSQLIATNNIIFCPLALGGIGHGFIEADSASDPASFQNNLIVQCQSALYYDEGATSRTTEAALNTAAQTTQGIASSSLGNLGPSSVPNLQAIMFTNAPVGFYVTGDNGDVNTTYDGTTTTVEIAGCGAITAGHYIEYNGDGIPRSIISCSAASGSGILTFSPALATASIEAKEIRLWGTNNANLDPDYHLTASTPASIRNGGKDSAQSTCGATGTASCGNVTKNADGLSRTAPYSIGPY